MAQVILIEPNQTIANLITINLTNSLLVDVIPRESSLDTIDLLKILPKVDLIVTASEVEGEKTAEKLIDFLTDRNIETPVLAIGPLDSKYIELCSHFEKFTSWKEVIEVAAVQLGVDFKKISEHIRPEFIAQPIAFFKSITSSCCDIHIRIKKGPGDFQFVKRFSAKDTFTKDVIEKYISQGLTHFYIPLADQERFTTFFSNSLIDNMEKEFNDDKTTIGRRVEIAGEAYDHAMAQLNEVGFNQSTINLADSIITGIEQNCDKVPKVGVLLSKILSSKSSLLYQKAHITSSIAIEALKSFIVNDPEKLNNSIRILTCAAFFNDIGLIENEELSVISNKEELDILDPSEDELKLINNHAAAASKIVSEFPENTVELQTIIKEHHGHIDGTELCSSPANEISGLSKIFVIAEDFARHILHYKEDKTSAPTSITSALYDKYKQPDYNAVITGIETQLNKKKTANN